MPYFVAFTNGEERELVVKAIRVKHDSSSSTMEFWDADGTKVAIIPINRILYIKKIDG